MGCDIHAFAEKRKGDKWVKVNKEFEHLDYADKKVWTDEPYDGRDYELFAFLADVRNSNGIKPLAQPKGVPEDASHGYLHEVECYGSDGHSHSFFTLKELKSIPARLLNQTIDDSSLIVEKDEKTGKITMTCASTNGKHYGKVGKRKLFKLFNAENNPIKEIIEQLESVVEDDDSDDDIRMVFFFDN